MDVDGCWLSVFVGDCLLQKKDSRLCIFVCLFGQSYHVCFFLGEKCHQTTYVSEVLGFCGREHRKKQAVNPQT